MESTLLSYLAEEGANIFTIRDVEDHLGKPYNNAKVIANRLVKKRWAIRLGAENTSSSPSRRA